MDFTEEQRKLLALDKGVSCLWERIEYWHAPGRKSTRLRVRKGGLYYLAKPHTEVTQECGLTRKQYRRCLEALKQVGLVTWIVKRYDCIPTIHIRCEHLIAKYGLEGQSEGQPVTNTKPKQTTATTNTTTTSIADATNHDDPSPMEKMEKEKKNSANFSAPKEGVMTHPYKGMSVDEIQAKLKGEVDPVKPIKFNGEYKASEVLRYFRKMCSIHYPELQHYSAPTAADLAQARSLSKSLSCTEVDPIAIITVLVPKWSQFRARVNTQLGYSDNFGPAVPHFGYLLKHRDIAMNCISDMQKQPPKSVPAKKAYYDGNGS